MKLKVRGFEDLPLAPSERRIIEQTIRLAIGIRAHEINTLRVDLRRRDDAPDRIHCSVSLRSTKGDRYLVEEDAANLDMAIEWAIWRVNHLLDRQALRKRVE